MGSPKNINIQIPVWLLVRQRQLGVGEEEILHDYPTLRAEDLSNAWNYYRAHRDEVEAQIAENAD